MEGQRELIELGIITVTIENNTTPIVGAELTPDVFADLSTVVAAPPEPDLPADPSPVAPE